MFLVFRLSLCWGEEKGGQECGHWPAGSPCGPSHSPSLSPQPRRAERHKHTARGLLPATSEQSLSIVARQLDEVLNALLSLASVPPLPHPSLGYAACGGKRSLSYF